MTDLTGSRKQDNVTSCFWQNVNRDVLAGVCFFRTDYREFHFPQDQSKLVTQFLRYICTTSFCLF